MIKKYFQYTIYFLFLVNCVFSQNPTNINLNSVPTNYAVDSYTRATTKINLLPGFKFEPTANNSNKLLNLSIGNNPTFVNSSYLGSATNPNPNGCTSGILDTNKPVGETSGIISVSNSGAAVYNIPIFCAPGTKGVQPQISIAYNSHSGLGTLGNAWVLSGISAITRSPKNVFHDGYSDGIKLTNDDAYSFDGNRLFGLTGVYGANNTTYYTEIQNFADITSYGNVNNAPNYFIVKDKNGNTIEYGNTPNSKHIGIGNSSILSWYINKITDEFGNYMLYNYSNNNGEIIISSIEYTGNSNAGLVPYNKIEFTYTELAEKTKNYINGTEFNMTKLLKTIVCTSNTNLVKKYILDYEWNKGTYLTSVKEVDSNGNELNPTFFCWENPEDYGGVSNFQSLDFSNEPLNYINLNTIPADIDGDGFSDVIAINSGSLGKIKTYKNNFKTNYGNTSNSNIAFSKIHENNSIMSNNASKFIGATVLDDDFDNKQDVYVSTSTPLFGNQKVISIDKFSYNGSSITESNVFSKILSNFDPDAKPSRVIYDKRDYDGDGTIDELITDPNIAQLTTSYGNIALPITSANTVIRPINFNNDGVIDFLVIDHSNNNSIFYVVFEINNAKSSSQSFNPIYTGTVGFPFNGLFASTTKNMLLAFNFGDFNGDGITDLIYLNEGYSKLKIQFGDGNQFLSPVEVSAFTAITSGAGVNVTLDVGDINSDGKSDITLTDNVQQTNNNPVNNYFTYYSIGNTLIKGASYSGNWVTETKTIWYNELVEYQGISYQKGWDVPITTRIGYQIKADYNGDGITDVASFNNPSQDRIIANNVSSLPKLAITGIKTPLKKNLRISYSNIGVGLFVTPGTKIESYNQSSSNSYNAPIHKYRPSMYCVHNISTFDGFNTQITRTKKYVYSDAIFHSKGKGFLGFTKVTTLDLSNLLGTQTVTEFNSTYNVGIEKEITDAKYIQSTVSGIIKYTLDNTKLIAKNTNITSLTPQNAKGYFISIDNTTSIDYLNSTAATTNLSYDLSKHGKLTTRSTTHGWVGQPVIKTVNNSYSYILNKGYFKPQSETTTITQAGESSYARTTEYNYDATQGYLTSIVNDPTFGTNMLTTTFSQFNAFGSPTKVDISAGDVANRTSNVVYDPTGRFVIKKINALGNFSEYTYDSKFGNVLTIKDITGLITTNKYDGLGRLIKTTTPNNAVNTITYAWDNLVVDGFAMGIYSIKTDIEGDSYSKKYYTGRDLMLREEALDFAGQIVVKDIKYSTATSFGYPQGTILEATEPHYFSQTKYLIQKFDYEPNYFRPSLVTTYSINGTSLTNTGIFNQTTYNNPSTSSAYNIGKITSSNQKNQSVEKTFNSAGQLTQLKNITTQQTQISTYAYTSNGQAKSIVLSNNINTSQNITHTFSYNNLGQKIQTTDPSAGVINCVYNTIGEQLQCQTPIGTFDFTYDVLGRLTSKNGSGSGLQNYFYYSSGNGLEALEKIIGPNSMTELKYDNLNRLIENKETIGTKILKTNYVLDKYGRVLETKAPNNFITKNTYNSFGYLTQINDANNQLIWQLVNQDALGRIREYVYGNGINTKVKYNELNNLTEINHNNSSIHKQTYDFDNLTGNLKNRQFFNYTNNTWLRENFNFDAVDRLLNCTQINTGNNSVIQNNATTFDPLGNITHKDDAGDLQYTNPSKPFTLTQINNASNNISLNTLNTVYTDFDKVSQISEMGTNKQMNFTYGTDYERIKMEYKINGISQYTRYYSQNFDVQENANATYKEWNYVFAPSGLCAISYNNNGTSQFLYTNTDHLGSPIQLTNNSQNVVEEYAFDGWGRRRNSTDWSFANISPSTIMIRGYTMHEHIDEFGLINMNGRVYDPIIGRFIQPDKYIQSPSNIQNFNRYAYCLNNPLNYTDPSGYEFSDLKGAFGNFFNGLFSAQNMGSSFNPNVQASAQQAAEVMYKYSQVTAKIQLTAWSVALGAGTAGLGSIIGVSGIIPGAIYGGATGALSGALTGGARAYINDGDMVKGAKKGALWGGIIGGVGGGISGGIDAAKHGKNIWTGKYSDTYFQSKGIELTGKPVKAEDLNEFANKNFGDRIDKMDYKPTFEINDAKVGGGGNRAVTIPDNYYKASTPHIYVKKAVLGSDKSLYMVLEHEMTHAELYSNGIYASWAAMYSQAEATRLSEVSAWLGSYNTAKSINSSFWEWLAYGQLMKYFRQ